MNLALHLTVRGVPLGSTRLQSVDNANRGTVFHVHVTPYPIRQRAKRIRHEPTISEQVVWGWLRGRRFGAFKFRRQHPIGCYELDFYCHELKLAIEVDGSHHNAEYTSESDLVRELALSGYGIEVCRVSNKAVAKDPEAVLAWLEAAIERAVKRS